MSDKDALNSFFAKKKGKQFKAVNARIAPVANVVEEERSAPVEVVKKEETKADDGWVETEEEVVQTFTIHGKSVGDLRAQNVEVVPEETQITSTKSDSRVWSTKTTTAAPISLAAATTSLVRFPHLGGGGASGSSAGVSSNLVQRSITDVATTNNRFEALEGGAEEVEAPAPRAPAAAPAAAPAPSASSAPKEAEAPKVDKYAGKKKKKKSEDSDDD